MTKPDKISVMINNIRPLSKCMIETLMEIHEREILKQQLCDQQTRYVKGLYIRKLVDTCNCRNKDGKPYIGFYVTEMGKQCLEYLTQQNDSPVNGLKNQTLNLSAA